jgi:hypothetical protein
MFNNEHLHFPGVIEMVIERQGGKFFVQLECRQAWTLGNHDYEQYLFILLALIAFVWGGH